MCSNQESACFKETKKKTAMGSQSIREVVANPQSILIHLLASQWKIKMDTPIFKNVIVLKISVMDQQPSP